MEETVAPEETGQVTEEVNPLAFDPSSLPEGLRAEPSLQTFDSVDKLAKSYVNAVKKMGSDPSTMVQMPKEGESWDNFYIKLEGLRLQKDIILVMTLKIL